MLLATGIFVEGENRPGRNANRSDTRPPIIQLTGPATAAVPSARP